MSSTTVAEFANELKKSTDTLLEQLKSAGVAKSAASDSLTDADLDELVMQVDMFLLYIADRKKRELEELSKQNNGKTIEAEV